MDWRPLPAGDFDDIHRAFVEAFSDYVVPLQPSPAQLREMLTRRGWSPELSIAAIEDGRIVALTLNGVDGAVAYDSGTGVVPTHRRRGLGREMIERLAPRLREAGCTRWILEVIDSNPAAVALYQANGFAITRPLQSWTFAGSSSEAQVIAQWDESFHDVAPSWQNTTASILRSRDPYVVLGILERDELLGYAIVYPSNGDVPQLAVRRTHRRRGLGRALLGAAAARAGKPLRLINVDARDERIAAFLTSCGARVLVGQWEMAREL